MESQRVKFLAKGYLRGWLNFDYTYKTSKLRENLIIHFLEEESYADLLEAKTYMDSALIGGYQNKTKGMLDSVDKTYQLLLALKLPELAVKSKINTTGGKMTQEQIDEWKALLKQGQEHLDKNKK